MKTSEDLAKSYTQEKPEDGKKNVKLNKANITTLQATPRSPREGSLAAKVSKSQYNSRKNNHILQAQLGGGLRKLDSNQRPATSQS